MSRKRYIITCAETFYLIFYKEVSDNKFHNRKTTSQLHTYFNPTSLHELTALKTIYEKLF